MAGAIAVIMHCIDCLPIMCWSKVTVRHRASSKELSPHWLGRRAEGADSLLNDLLGYPSNWYGLRA